MSIFQKPPTSACRLVDDVLCGGLDAQRLYLVEREPGTGKTTLALQFLLEGGDRTGLSLHLEAGQSIWLTRADVAVGSNARV